VVAAVRRHTNQRASILEVLAGTDEFVSAQDLHGALRSAGSSIGLATVYRALSDMATAGEVDTLRNQHGEIVYRRCGESQHHHHLVCRICGRTEEVTAPGVERWAKAVADEYGFVDINHEIELYGVCADCAADRESS
jgi:Fur family ferric uptake transcriptional regulator